MSLLIFISPKVFAEKFQLDDKRWINILIAEPAVSPKALLILFPGEKGLLSGRDKSDEFSNNFLIRSRHLFVKQGFKIIVLGESSWAKEGYDDKDRISSQHAEDVADLIKIQNKQSIPVYGIGTSRSTVSVAAIAIAKPNLFNGVVLTSTVSRNSIFQSLQLSDTKVSVLFLHHELDGCPSSPIKLARAIYDSLKSKIKIEFKSLNGGANVSKNPCRAKTFHGFWQTEQLAVDTIASWIGK